MTKKAEALVEKMKELNIAFTTRSYNSIIEDMKAHDVLPMPDVYTGLIVFFALWYYE